MLSLRVPASGARGAPAADEGVAGAAGPSRLAARPESVISLSVMVEPPIDPGHKPDKDELGRLALTLLRELAAQDPDGAEEAARRGRVLDD